MQKNHRKTPKLEVCVVLKYCWFNIPKSEVLRIMCRNSKSGTFRIPCAETPVLGLLRIPALKIISVLYRKWRRPFAKLPVVEFLRITQYAIIPLLDVLWRGRRWSTSGICLYMGAKEMVSHYEIHQNIWNLKCSVSSFELKNWWVTHKCECYLPYLFHLFHLFILYSG